MGGAMRPYHSANERIEVELRHEFHLRDLDRAEARLLLRMIDQRIPLNKEEILRRESLRRRIERAAEVVVYRCGWCGTPVRADGRPLDPVPDMSMDEYVEGADRVVNVSGFCCPHGDATPEDQHG